MQFCIYPTLGATQHPLYRRLGGPRGQSGWARKAMTPPASDPRTVQPVANRYTGCAIENDVTYKKYIYNKQKRGHVGMEVVLPLTPINFYKNPTTLLDFAILTCVLIKEKKRDKTGCINYKCMSRL